MTDTTGITIAGRSYKPSGPGPKRALNFALEKMQNGGVDGAELDALHDWFNAINRHPFADALDDARDAAGQLDDEGDPKLGDDAVEPKPDYTSDAEIERLKRQIDDLKDDPEPQPEAGQGNGKPYDDPDPEPEAARGKDKPCDDPDPDPEPFDPADVEPDEILEREAARQAEYVRLAELPAGEYELVRKEVAARLGMRVSALDKMVDLHRPGAAAVAEKAKLVSIANDHLELWCDHDSETFATTKAVGPANTVPVRSTDLRRWLLRTYGELHPVTLENGDEVPGAPNAQAIREALDQLDAIARGNTPTRRSPGLRVADDGDGGMVLDLADDDYHVIHVTRHGWEVTKLSPVPMRRADGMRALPVPDAGCAVGAAGRLPLDQLRELLGYADAEHAEEWALLVGFLFATFQPTGPKPVLVLSGEQGSGKTTVIRALRRMVDPHKTAVQSRPKSEQDLFVNGNGQWLIGYDNLSAITPDWSDAFCRVATGATWSGRRLYTDGEVVQYEVCRPQIITSIVDAVSQPDLLDRSLLVALPTIPEERRREEPALLRAVDDLVPAVLGQLLDATVEALDAAEDLEVSYRPRMVGLVRWVEAGADHLGLEPDQFSEAYRSSHGRASEIALDSSMVGLALRQMLSTRDHYATLDEASRKFLPYPGEPGFHGTASDLLRELNEYRARLGDKPGAGWPKTPRGMSGAIRRIATPLRQAGYRVLFEVLGHDKAHFITIEAPK